MAVAAGMPVGSFTLMSAAPGVALTDTEKTLQDYSDKLTVIHLYTG